MNNMLCPSCGSLVIVGGSYCVNCGHRLVRGEAPVDPATAGQRDETAETPGETSVIPPARVIQSPWLARAVPASDERVGAPHVPQAPPIQPASSSTAPRATTSSSFNTRLTPQRASQGGMVWAAAGGAAATLSFFVLPYVNFGLLGSATGIQTIKALNTLGQACSQSGSSGPSSCNQVANLGGVLWVQVVCAAVIAITAGLAWLASQQNRAGASREASTIVLVAGGVGTLATVLPMLVLRSSAEGRFIISVLGIGYWVMLIGLITATIGAIAQLRA